jgi:hypothetical protein
MAVGVKVTLMVQLESAASEALQLLVWLNSLALVPVMLIKSIARTAFPVLLSVIGCEALVVPTVCELKLRFVGESETTGACPTPVSGTTCGLPAASSAMVSVSFAVPGADGVKMTLIVQNSVAVSGVGATGQLLVCEKPLASIMLVIKRLSVPELVSVTGIGELGTPTIWPPKFTFGGEREAVGKGIASLATKAFEEPSQELQND